MRFDDLIAEAVEAQDGDFVAGVLAEKLVAQVLEREPSSLDEWLHAHAAPIVTDRIARIANGRRATAQRQARARAFGHASDAYADGDLEALSPFATFYVVDDDNTRRRVADMTGDDHRFVADGYRASAEVDRMLAAFHVAVAKKVKSRRTADAMNEAEYERLYASIVKQP